MEVIRISKPTIVDLNITQAYMTNTITALKDDVRKQKQCTESMSAQYSSMADAGNDQQSQLDTRTAELIAALKAF